MGDRLSEGLLRRKGGAFGLERARRVPGEGHHVMDLTETWHLPASYFLSWRENQNRLTPSALGDETKETKVPPSCRWYCAAEWGPFTPSQSSWPPCASSAIQSSPWSVVQRGAGGGGHRWEPRPQRGRLERFLSLPA